MYFFCAKRISLPPFIILSNARIPNSILLHFISNPQKAPLPVSAHNSIHTTKTNTSVKRSKLADASGQNLQLCPLHHQYIQLVTWEAHK